MYICAHYSLMLENCFSVSAALQKSVGEYTSKLDAGNAAEQTLFTLGWEAEELKQLMEDGRKLLVELRVVLDTIVDVEASLISKNIPRRLTVLREKLSTFVTKVTRHQRTAATHVLVIMISTEDHCRKP